jgi:hypothetical protein
MTHVSALTSQMTDRVRLGAERDSRSTKSDRDISELLPLEKIELGKKLTGNLGGEVDAVHEDIRIM